MPSGPGEARSGGVALRGQRDDGDGARYRAIIRSRSADVQTDPRNTPEVRKYGLISGVFRLSGFVPPHINVEKQSIKMFLIRGFWFYPGLL